jgi:hypothetical protein
LGGAFELWARHPAVERSMTLVRRAPRPADVVILPGRIGPDGEARPAFDCPPQTTHAEIERALDVLAERAARRLDWDRLRGAASAAEVAGAIVRAVERVNLTANGIGVLAPFLCGDCDAAARSAVAASLYRRLRPQIIDGLARRQVYEERPMRRLSEPRCASVSIWCTV